MINDLRQVDLLHTRTVRDGTTITLQVRSGVTVLNERVFTNATQTLPAELDGILREMVNEVIRDPAARVNSAGQLTDSLGNPIEVGGNVVKISGSFTQGSTLTANLAAGWTASGYQWTRNGVDIAGATNSKYVLQVADIAKDVRVKVTGLTFTEQTGGIVQYTGPALLRFATAFNKFPNQVYTPTVNTGFERRLAGRMLRPIGSTSYKSIRLSAFACAMQESDRIYSTVNPLTVNSAYIECNGITVPVTWGGVANPTFAAGSYDQVSDPIYPSQFGLTTFNRNRVLYVRGEVAVPPGGRLPSTEGVETGSEGWYFSSENGQMTNLGGTGALRYTGTGRTSGGELPFVVIGEQSNIVDDAATWLGFGDSIFAQGGEWSYFQMALRGDTSAYIAGCAVAKVGGTFSIITYGANEIGSLAKYANRVVDGIHTNSVGLVLGSLQAYSQDVWAFWRARKSTHALARGFRVIRAELGIGTGGSWGSLGSQGVSDNWNSGGVVEQLNDWFATRVGQSNGPDYVCADLWSTPNLVRGASTGKGTADSGWYKWAFPNYTGDGLHPTHIAASPLTGLGANLRSHMLNAANL